MGGGTESPYLIYERKVSKNSRQAKTSALPTIPDTCNTHVHADLEDTRESDSSGEETGLDVHVGYREMHNLTRRRITVIMAQAGAHYSQARMSIRAAL